jgi:predicted 3-demethylubiquinone-9 3-methyltransferase (glyoxalase superfamily)
MPKVSPFLWFAGNMQEAVGFYVSVFDGARVVEMNATMARFELLGREFLALNAHPHHTFNEAISFFIECSTQDEVDRHWNALTAGGGKELMCGWLKDKFGARGK